MNLKEIKKVLMTGKGKIIIKDHTKLRLMQRGYSKGDIVASIFNGEILERQGPQKVVITGHDKDQNPIVVVIAKKSDLNFKICMVMPPINHQRFKDCDRVKRSREVDCDETHEKNETRRLVRILSDTLSNLRAYRWLHGS